MTVARRTHIIASSEKSFEDALNRGLERAGQTLRGITGIEVVAQKAKVENGKIREYRVECYVTFVLED